MVHVKMEVLALICLFGLCASVEGQLTMDGVRNAVEEMMEEKLKSYSGEENRLLWEEVDSLRRTQSRMEADLEAMQTKINKLTRENENSKKKIDELYKENLELKRLVKDTVNSKVDTGHSNESVIIPARAKSVRFLANPGVPGTAPIAFSARLSQTLDSVHDDEIFFFDNIITNSGNAYNKNNGMFTAPLKGIYAFYSSILTSAGKSLEAHIVRNGNEFCNLYAGDMDFWGPGFNMAVIELEVGDAVWVKIHEKYHGAGVRVDGPWTSFTGFLLYETE